MTELSIVVGNKNYSSWSMRGWLPLRHTGAEFGETVIPLDLPETPALKAQHCPAGKVPVLRHGERAIWDSLAIAEYLAETFPDAGLWPADGTARAMARSVAAEMHSGFPALRTHMPMNVRASRPGDGRGEGVAADIGRIFAIWHECRARFGADGDFLFGAWSIADMCFAPVVSRFATYGVEMDQLTRAYATAVTEQPDVAAWLAAAREEPWTIPEYDGPLDR